MHNIKTSTKLESKFINQILLWDVFIGTMNFDIDADIETANFLEEKHTTWVSYLLYKSYWILTSNQVQECSTDSMFRLYNEVNCTNGVNVV